MNNENMRPCNGCMEDFDEDDLILTNAGNYYCEECFEDAHEFATDHYHSIKDDWKNFPKPTGRMR